MKARQQIKNRRQAQIQRRNRTLIIGAVILIALFVVGILILQTPPRSNNAAIVIPTKQAWPQASGKTMGPANAKVVVTEFADFQCPVCDNFHATIWPQLISQYVATGKVRFEYRHYIVIDQNVGGVESRRAAEASECANEQNAFWDYATILLANQQQEGSGTFSDERLKTMAANIGLDATKFNACFDGRKDASLVTADEGKAISYGLNATPSVLVNGVLMKNPMDFAEIKTAIEASLAK